MQGGNIDKVKVARGVRHSVSKKMIWLVLLSVLLAPLFLGIVFALWGQFGNIGYHYLTNGSFEQYKELSSFSNTITLPSSAKSIDVFAFLGFDTNHIFVRASVATDKVDLGALMRQSVESLADTREKRSYAVIERAKVSLQDFDAFFDNGIKCRPDWWNCDFSRFDQQLACCWETSNNYGYGYMYLLDSSKGELRVFRWSQQYNKAAETRKLLAE